MNQLSKLISSEKSLYNYLIVYLIYFQNYIELIVFKYNVKLDFPY